jgi:hypothetical protein
VIDLTPRRLILVLATGVAAGALGPGVAQAAVPQTGYWYGEGDGVQVGFRVGPAKGHALKTRRFFYSAYGKRCAGVRSLGMELYMPNARFRPSGAFSSPIGNGTKGHVQGTTKGTSIDGVAGPTKGHGLSAREIACFRRSFTARPVPDPHLSKGKWRGTLAAQPGGSQDLGNGDSVPFEAIPAVRLELQAEKGGFLFGGSGDEVELRAQCAQDGTGRNPTSTSSSGPFLDRTVPVGDLRTFSASEASAPPDGSKLVTTIAGTFQDPKHVTGTARLEATLSDGTRCDSGDLRWSASR